MKKEELSKDEAALVEAKRKRDESINLCRKEIEEVLEKHKMNLKISFPAQPTIVLEQRA